jgi:Ca2+-binding RTX toxin-like protein
LTGILVNGKGGGDTITVASNVTLTETLFGGAGPDSIIGGGGSALLGGGAGSDTLVGGSSTSLLVPGQFETFTAALNGKDVLIGGSGFAIADLAYRTDPMFLSNDGKNDSGDPNLGEKLTIMPSVLAIWGGAGNDTVVGTVAGEFLSGGSGNATIQGGGTDDLLVGGLGTDTVRVAAEPVTLYLDNGNANRYTGVDNPDEDVLQLDSEDVSF